MNYVIVGLGNPGIEYKNTRHNIGREVVEAFAHANGAGSFVYDKYANSLLVSASYAYKQDHEDEVVAVSDDLHFVLPETFMNRSGEAVAYVVQQYTGDFDLSSQLIVVQDELALPVGEVRISHGKNSGGNNGIESIIAHVKTKDFIRVRIGIGPITPDGEIKELQGDAVKRFVLNAFASHELERMKQATEQSMKALHAIVQKGYVQAMNDCN